MAAARRQEEPPSESKHALGALLYGEELSASAPHRLSSQSRFRKPVRHHLLRGQMLGLTLGKPIQTCLESRTFTCLIM